MERKNKKELLLHIDEQNKRLQKYKSRLHDVVESYKNLIKEKEALESSVKFLTESCPAENTGISEKSSDNEDTRSDNNVSKEERELPDSFGSLKTNLRTLTVEKARIENELKVDRKRLLKENEDLQLQLEKQKTLWDEEQAAYENSLQELHKQVREQQKEREKEQQDHSVMLKELQNLVADERCSKEKFEQQLENLKLALEKLPDKRFEYEKQISELQNELVTVKELLRAAEGEKKDLPSLLRQLQQEMNEMKEQHQEAVEREVRRANNAEEKLKAVASVSEERAASLEQRLSDLSQMVGNYDKLRQQDQIAIDKLKERVAQLDQENRTLARTIAGSEKNYDFHDDLDVEAIVDQIAKLKSCLHSVSQKSKRSISMSGLFNEVLKDDEINFHAACQMEAKLLKEELEHCKQKLQLEKNKHAADTELQSEKTFLKKQVKSLEEELETYRMQLKSMVEHYEKTQSNLERCITEMKAKHAHENMTQRKEFQLKLSDLEQQLLKQRERSLIVLEDKEKEIISLKSSFQLQGRASHEAENDIPKRHSSMSESSKEENSLPELLSTLSSGKKGRQLLHYTQELARKDVEISNLRRCRSQAESALRELQQNSLLKEENYQIEIDNLNSQIKRIESAQKGINMEYLKNVVLRFIKCNDASGQSHMINAIAAILHFTPRELQEIKASR